MVSIEVLEARVLFSASPIHSRPAAAGSLDTSFGQGGIAAGNEFAGGPIVEPDGRILILSPDATNQLECDLPNGTPDPSFGTEGIIDLPPEVGDLPGMKAAIQSDGKIVLAGIVNASLIVSRLNNNGSTDSSFGINGSIQIANWHAVTAVGIQADDKICVLGGTLLHLNSNGSVDNTFGAGGEVTFDGFTPNGFSVALDDHLIVSGVGDYVLNQTAPSLFLRELNPDGSTDTSFGTAGTIEGPKLDTLIPHVVVQSDGKIVVATTPFIGQPSRITVFRFNTNGTTDTSFGRNGTIQIKIGSVSKVTGDTACAIAINAEGDIVVAAGGYTGTQNFNLPNKIPRRFALVELTETGKVNRTFGHNGHVSRRLGRDYALATVQLAMQPDDKVVVESGGFLERYFTS